MDGEQERRREKERLTKRKEKDWGEIINELSREMSICLHFQNQPLYPNLV